MKFRAVLVAVASSILSVVVVRTASLTNHIQVLQTELGSVRWVEKNQEVSGVDLAGEFPCVSASITKKRHDYMAFFVFVALVLSN